MKSRNNFFFGFTLLQNSNLIEELNEKISFILSDIQQRVYGRRIEKFVMIKNLIKKRNIDLIENFDFENVNYKKIRHPIQDDLSYSYFNKFEAIESLYISHYENNIKNLKDGINSKRLSAEKNLYYNPQLFGVIKSITFNSPLLSGVMIRNCQEKLKKSSNFNKLSPFFQSY